MSLQLPLKPPSAALLCPLCPRRCLCSVFQVAWWPWPAARARCRCCRWPWGSCRCCAGRGWRCAVCASTARSTCCPRAPTAGSACGPRHRDTPGAIAFPGSAWRAALRADSFTARLRCISAPTEHYLAFYPNKPLDFSLFLLSPCFPQHRESLSFGGFWRSSFTMTPNASAAELQGNGFLM